MLTGKQTFFGVVMKMQLSARIVFCLIMALMIVRSPGNASAALPGDFNGDGVVSIAEVQTCINSFLGIGPNNSPVANAGTSLSIVVGTVITLDGSGSSDANNDSLTYSWALSSKPGDSSATLSSTTVVKPTFTPDVAGVYVINLIVNDGKVNSAAATVSITALPNTGSITVRW